jgi:hypothetical protein
LALGSAKNRFRRFFRFKEIPIRKTNKTRRVKGHIVHVGESRTGRFWAVIKDENNTPYFAYGLHFFDCPQTPKPGWNCEFSVLPAIDGKLQRATEIQILPSERRTITLAYEPDGAIRILAGDRCLGELRLE